MNNKSIENRRIKQKQVCNIIDAANFAYESGWPLNRAITMSMIGIECRPQDVTAGFFKRASDWLRYRGSPPAWISILEHPFGCTLNCHILIHCPPQLHKAFARQASTWAKAAGLKAFKGAFHSQVIGIRPRTRYREISDGEYLANLEREVAYMLKGSAPEICDALLIDAVDQGTIHGRRVSVSQAIGLSRRRKAGFLVPHTQRGARIFRWRCKLEPEGAQGAEINSRAFYLQANSP